MNTTENVIVANLLKGCHQTWNAGASLAAVLRLATRQRSLCPLHVTSSIQNRTSFLFQKTNLSLKIKIHFGWVERS